MNPTPSLSNHLRKAGVSRQLQALAKDLERRVERAKFTAGELERLATAMEDECARQREMISLIREYLARQTSKTKAR